MQILLLITFIATLSSSKNETIKLSGTIINTEKKSFLFGKRGDPTQEISINNSNFIVNTRLLKEDYYLLDHRLIFLSPGFDSYIKLYV